ncbi:MAG: hypothetical protein JWP26_1643 [Devosia sp.]|uniref:DUF6384 family protein n=1 Tax=Devosia sp. TaxID=1871048 RepID=UPI00260E8A32|nr:DUF6384 family protein [Devosia sp.]MDB5586673.1 hypothetical protein [Devosia sp.]
MSDVTAKPAAPLDEIMLAMDVVDTLRHRQDLATRELDGVTREQQLIDKLRAIYHQQGIEVTDDILKEGVSALAESRFVYDPPKPSFGATVARLYTSRGKWGRPVVGVVVALAVFLGGYYLVYKPYQANIAEQARVELVEGLPAQMDAIYQTIFEETKVQQAVVQAEDWRTRGKAYAAEGNRPQAEAALGHLTALRDQLRQQYTLRVVNRPGVQSGVWTIPQVNTAATNYYIIVEAIDPDDQALSLPILNEETGQTETVAMWALRVPESVYNAVAADKQDDGIIQTNEVGRKSDGFLDVEYLMPTLGGALTRW